MQLEAVETMRAIQVYSEMSLILFKETYSLEIVHTNVGNYVSLAP